MIKITKNKLSLMSTPVLFFLVGCSGGSGASSSLTVEKFSALNPQFPVPSNNQCFGQVGSRAKIWEASGLSQLDPLAKNIIFGFFPMGTNDHTIAFRGLGQTLSAHFG